MRWSAIVRQPTGLSFLVASIAVLHSGVAFVLLFGGRHNESGSLQPAQSVLSLPAWAALFALVALAVAVAAASHQDRWLVWSSIAGAGLCTWWAAFFIAGALMHPTASVIGIPGWISLSLVHVSASLSASVRMGR